MAKDLEQRDPGAGLAERILAGDESAEHEFVLEFGPRVNVLVLARTRNPDVADDLVQDVLLAVLMSLRDGKLEDPAKLSGFVLGTARNIVSNFLRRSNPLRLNTDTLHAPRSDWPDWRASESQRRRLVGREIERLDATDRKILSLTLVKGMKPGEIAAELDLSAELVRQRKSRAIRRIAERIRSLSRNTAGGYLKGRK